MTGHEGAVPGFMTRLHRGRRLRMTRAATRRAGVVLLSAWLLALIATTAPHLVHHAFDPDEGADCVFLDVAYHAPGVTAAPVVLLPLHLALEPLAVPRGPVCPLRQPARPLTRSPPAVALAAS